MKVIFLDVDGVLNSDDTEIYTREGYISVDPKNVEPLLKFLNDHPEIKIVLSSTWRLHAEMYEYLHSAGIHWIDVTKNLGGRGREVQEWLDRHPDVEKYAIIDDIGDWFTKEQTVHHLVWTNGVLGLTDLDMVRLNKILS